MSESQIVEYKESWRDEYLKWICGFANAQGGVIYIGRKDDGTPCGVEDSKRLLEDIPNKVRDVLGLIVDVDLETMDGKDVVKIIVPENPYPVNYKGEYHYRTGSTKQLLQGSALTSFLLKKTGKKWDAVPLENDAVDDLDKESFDIFYREAVRSGRMSADDLKLSRHDLLEKLNLLDGEYLKRAAVLLFHRNPEKWITGSFVKPNREPNARPNARPNQKSEDIDNKINTQFKKGQKRPNQRPNQRPNLSARQTKILSIIIQKDRTTIEELSEVLNIGKTTVKEELSFLQQEGFLMREGGTRGRWVVTLDTKTL
ncbi:MAG: DeoR family transcriptional regulator [Bacteroidales bacterium]|jgi:predicted HTH transcriptional regulator|nr:DeoR family transcriptional regulator [Bacteroidales bacterium]